jgi:hypothetical protein
MHWEKRKEKNLVGFYSIIFKVCEYVFFYLLNPLIILNGMCIINEYGWMADSASTTAV